MIKFLKDEDGYKRKISVETLSELKAITAIPQLIETYKNEVSNDYWDIKQKIIESLGEIGDKSSVPFLLGELENNKEKFAYYVITSLGKIGDKSVVPQLVKLLKEDFYYITVYNALSRIGDESVIQILIDTLMAKWNILSFDSIEYARESFRELIKKSSFTTQIKYLSSK